MLKASALYMVIIIALVIGILCSSLIVMAYFYRLQYQKTFRHEQLQNNVASAVNILLGGADTSYAAPKTFSLFNEDADSVSTQRIFWGTMDIGVAEAMIQQDTLYKAFSIASTIDSSKWAAVYLDDNSRPLSLSGTTSIIGDAYLSPAGVDQAYVNNQAYTGDKRLIIGAKRNSEKTLPPLNAGRLQKLQQLIQQNRKNEPGLSNSDSLINSFLLPVKIINLGSTVTTLTHLKLSGNIILFSDTALTLDSTAQLNQVIIIAKSITVNSGFHGACQLFAHDTIGVQPRCRFDYPSALAIVRFDPPSQPEKGARISLSANVVFNGCIFAYELQPGKLPPLIHIGQKAIVKGLVYSQGYVEFQDKAEIDGSVFTDRFLYQTSYTRYENYVVNTTINEKLLSPYYLSSALFPVATQKKKILRWLEAN
ncbi:hypothetical protein [Mucilaginibacter sp.]